MSGARPNDRISLRTTGGLARIPRAAEPWAVTFDELSSTDAQAVMAAIVRADFFGRPVPMASTIARDARTYELKIEIGDQSRALRISEPFGDQALADLVRLVRKLKDA